MVAACLRGSVGPHPFGRGSTARAGPRLKPTGILPSGKEPVGEPRVEEGGERLPLGNMGVGLGLGSHPFGGNRDNFSAIPGRRSLWRAWDQWRPWRQAVALGSALPPQLYEIR